jgi:hypothetical protein
MFNRGRAIGEVAELRMNRPELAFGEPTGVLLMELLADRSEPRTIGDSK